MINAYEKLIKTMRIEGARNNPNGLVLGTYNNNCVSVGDLEFEEEDILISEHLTKNIVEEVVLVDDVLKKSYIHKLQNGDTVLCYILDDSLVVIDKLLGDLSED